jgi:HPt (histidine-containing phosphotransfer) domain-containing protein
VCGASGNAGAPVLQETAPQLEASCKANDLSRGEFLPKQLDQEFERLKQVLAGEGDLARGGG